MTDYSLSQTVSISELPRDYLSLLKLSQKKGEPVVLLRHNKPIGAIIAKKVLDSLVDLKLRYEEEKILKLVKEGEAEYKKGKTATKLP